MVTSVNSNLGLLFKIHLSTPSLAALSTPSLAALLIRLSTEKAAEVGVDKRNFEPHSPTILTKCAPFSSRALNFRYRLCSQV